MNKRTLDNALFSENGLNEQHRIAQIRKRVQAEYPYSGDETAFARKGIHLALIYLAKTYPEIKEDPAFIEIMNWYNKVEVIKTEVKEELGI